MQPESHPPILFVVVNNHFDLTWRRCWQRPFQFQGQSFISYVDLETYYLLDNISLAQRNPDYKFEAESVQVVRKFLERCPEKLVDLQQLAREGRFAITGGGESIVDANMILGESLVRNMVDGLLWVEQTFDRKTRLAVRNDAFGNSAQLPQVLRGCEIAWATGMSYSPAWNLYWRGLDGSTILHRSLPIADRWGGVWKYPPCPACAGSGRVGGAECPECAGRGISSTLKAFLPRPIDPTVFENLGAALVLSMPEEMLPNPALLDWVKEMNVQWDTRFALEEDVFPFIQAWLDQVDNPPEELLHPGLELNPNNSGCLVTRIKTKQMVRRQEHNLIETEALCVMAALAGQAYPAQSIQRIRQDQYFTMFHDAITATHVDAAYKELEEIWQSIDRETVRIRAQALNSLAPGGQPGDIISIINPTGQPLTAICKAVLAGANLADATGQPVEILSNTLIAGGQVVEFVARDLPAYGARTYRASPGGGEAGQVGLLAEPVIENTRFRVQADEHGLVDIFDKVLNRPVVISDGLRPVELVLEHDEGSPWATLHHDHTRSPLSAFTRLCAVETAGPVQRLVFEIETPREMGFSGKCLRAKLTASLVEGLDRVDFHLSASWEAFNHRLRVALPVPRRPGDVPKHMYEIPYGMLERKPYPPTYGWAGANGDWPAIHWAGVELPGLSVALFNRGTPSYRMESGPGNSEVILLSLLRSPAIPTYLHEPEYYSMTDWDGMRDSGEHAFAFAVSAYAQPFSASSVVLDGEAYHATPIAVKGTVDLPAMPTIGSGPARISAVKWAEAGNGIVLRLVEFRGQGGEVVVHVPSYVQLAAKTNLLERQDQVLPIHDGQVRLSLRAWEIATLKLLR